VTCSECQSPDLRKISLLYESGVTFIDTQSRGAGVGTMGVGVGGARNRGTHTTALALKLAPPKPRPYGAYYVWAGLLAFIALGAQAYWLLFVSAIIAFAAETPRKWMRDEYPVLSDRWGRSFMCQRCGWIGIPSTATTTTVKPVLPRLENVSLPPSKRPRIRR